MSTPGPILPMVVSGPIDMSAGDLEAARRRLPFVMANRSTFIRWQVAATGFATALAMGWVCIIALLILQERWQLVLVAWVLLYTASHFAYCYCKRNSVSKLKRQLRLRIVAQVSEQQYPGCVSTEKKDDKPPSYIDAIDMEQPPPTYIMAVKHIRKSTIYSEENESSKVVTEANDKNSSETISNNRSILLYPHNAAAVLTSAVVLPIAMAIPNSSSTLSLSSLASVHSNRSTSDTSTDPTIKTTVSESVRSIQPSVSSSSEKSMSS